MTDTPNEKESQDVLGRLTDAISDFRKLANVPLGTAGAVHKKVVAPAWQQVTQGETRWAAACAVAVAVVLQLKIPEPYSVRPGWLLPAIVTILLVILLLTSPKQLGKRTSQIRILSLALIALLSIANIYSGGYLIYTLLNTKNDLGASELLITGGCIWATNVIVFALWYWEFDRGGPGKRAQGVKPFPDFLFAQMQEPELAPSDWEPEFPDYLYLSFTNAAAFSPTDVLPMSRWTKMTMLLQSAVSLALVALVIARAINIL